MAKKIKFALEMNGVKIRTMEELQENFNLDATVQYLLDGKLLTWLEDRFYEDEAEKVAELDKNSPQIKQELCEILGVEYAGESGMDVDELERLNEKKRILKTMTDDEEIIANADKTALDQDDLADLLNAGKNTIYLCGDNFSVPIRFKNVRYVGILGIPRVKIKAVGEDELKEKDITFENVILPFESSTHSLTLDNHPNDINTTLSLYKTLSMDELNEIFDSSFHEMPKLKAINKYKEETGTKPDYKLIFDIIDSQLSEIFLISEIEDSGKIPQEPSPSKKTIILKSLFQNKYVSDDIIYLRAKMDLTAGWAFTKDSFCIGGSIGNEIIPYENIQSVNAKTYGRDPRIDIVCKNNRTIKISSKDNNDSRLILLALIGDIGNYIKNYLETVSKIINLQD